MLASLATVVTVYLTAYEWEIFQSRNTDEISMSYFDLG